MHDGSSYPIPIPSIKVIKQHTAEAATLVLPRELEAGPNGDKKQLSYARWNQGHGDLAWSSPAVAPYGVW